MKNIRPTYALVAISLISTSFLSSCEKDNSTSGSDTIEGLLYYYTNEANKELRVIDIDANTPFRRSITLADDYTLEDLAIDRDYLVLKVYRPSSVSPLASKKGLMVKSKVAENNWLHVTDNPVGLTSTTDDGWFEASDYSDNATGFKFHKTDEIDGEDVFAIESIEYPGMYFSYNGHPVQGANLLYLETYSSPEAAPKFRLYRPESNFQEGNINVPRDAQFSW